MGTEIERSTGSPIVIRPQNRPPADYTDADYTITGETAERLIKARNSNTQRAYDLNWKQFTRWCDAEGRVALPATPQTLAGYVTRLIGISLAPKTIEQVIGTIRSKHTDAGYARQPDTRETIRLLNAYRHEWADAGGRLRQATPILLDALRAMVGTCDPETLTGQRDRSLLLLGFNAMCRRSELSGLDIGDFVPTADEGVSLFIRYSKTDRAAKGAKVSVPFGQHASTCAVRATDTWLAALAEHGITSGPLYCPIDRHGHLGGEPAYAGTASARLTGRAVSDRVRHRALLAGLDKASTYSGHSLRSGAATAAYLGGAPVAEIAKHGRWRENSPVVLGYIRAVDEWNNNPMKGIGL